MFSTSLASAADFPAILALQERNHMRHLPEAARGDGFLTTYLELPKLEFLVAQNGLLVAKAGDELAGFVGVEAWTGRESEFRGCVAAILPLYLHGREISTHNSRLYGPVCVAAAFRGQGVLPLLVAAVRAQFGARYEFGLTFIDHQNGRSLAAHTRKLGFEVVAQLPYADTNYHVLAFSL